MNEERAELARQKARELGDMLHSKQLAYGDSGAIALGLWMARLAQYRGEVYADGGFKHDPGGPYYLIPVELAAHIPRITRLDDRINRIISNPSGDRSGEDPWMDAAGDSIIGAISPRFPESGKRFKAGQFADAATAGKLHRSELKDILAKFLGGEDYQEDPGLYISEAELTIRQLENANDVGRDVASSTPIAGLRKQYGICLEYECEYWEGHTGPHAKVNAAGRWTWTVSRRCPASGCEVSLGHIGPHVDGAGRAWTDTEMNPNLPGVAFGDGFREDAP